MTSETVSSLRYPPFWKSLACVMLATVVALTLMPSPRVMLLSWDKAQHCITYAVLLWTFLQAWEGRYAVRWGVAFIVTGVGLEIAQGFMGLRFMEYSDMIANSLGVLIGYAVWRTPLGQVFLRIEAIVPVR